MPPVYECEVCGKVSAYTVDFVDIGDDGFGLCRECNAAIIDAYAESMEDDRV